MLRIGPHSRHLGMRVAAISGKAVRRSKVANSSINWLLSPRSYVISAAITITLMQRQKWRSTNNSHCQLSELIGQNRLPGAAFVTRGRAGGGTQPNERAECTGRTVRFRTCRRNESKMARILTPSTWATFNLPSSSSSEIAQRDTKPTPRPTSTADLIASVESRSTIFLNDLSLKPAFSRAFSTTRREPDG
jgi:hypothetical protein